VLSILMSFRVAVLPGHHVAALTTISRCSQFKNYLVAMKFYFHPGVYDIEVVRKVHPVGTENKSSSQLYLYGPGISFSFSSWLTHTGSTMSAKRLPVLEEGCR
jgi:hypothetical protein